MCLDYQKLISRNGVRFDLEKDISICCLIRQVKVTKKEGYRPYSLIQKPYAKSSLLFKNASSSEND